MYPNKLNVVKIKTLDVKQQVYCGFVPNYASYLCDLMPDLSIHDTLTYTYKACLNSFKILSENESEKKLLSECSYSLFPPFFSLWRIFSKTSSQKKSTNFYSRKSIFATNCCPLSCSKDANKRKALSRRWQISKRHDQPYWYIGFRPRITIFEVKHAAKGI